jgi:uncharacterized membrane protein YfbV (UPF0208 family)
MNLFTYYLRNRIFVITDLALIVVPVLFLVIGWKWLTTFSYLLAVFGAAILVVIAIFGVIVLGDRLYLNRVKNHIDMGTYRRQQLTALPLSSLSDETFVEENPQVQNRSQGLLPDANTSVANLQTGANANFANTDAKIADEIDEQILDAFEELVVQKQKPTGIAIAQMTGIPQRTVYDRMEKLKDKNR